MFHARDGAIFSKNSTFVFFDGASPITENGIQLRSPSPIMAPDGDEQAMQQTRNQLLVSRERKRTRECGVRRGGARGIMGVFFWTHNLVRFPSSYYQATGYESGSTVSGGQSRRKGKALRFDQLYEIKVAPLSRRPCLEFPFSSCTSLEFPAVKQIPSP